MKKIIAAIAVAGAVVLSCTACWGSGTAATDGNARESAQQAYDTTSLEATIPLPYYPFSQIRMDLVDIEAINALGIQSTAFFFVPGIDHPVFTCVATGVPVPATDQLSNPNQVEWRYNGADGVASAVTGQMEPTGIYAGDTTGTNNLCNDPARAKQFLGYDEAYTVALTARAHWDTTAKMIVVDGDPVMPVCHVQTRTVGKNSDGTKKISAAEVCYDPTRGPGK